MKFAARIEPDDKVNATGIPVPEAVVAALGKRRLPVVVTVEGYACRSTLFTMGGAVWVPLAKEHRLAAGVVAGQEVAVEIVEDTAPREVAVPQDLAAALAAAGK